MSQTYIPGIVDNIKSDSTPYSPIIEAITNSIDAITECGREDGRIDITVERENLLANAADNELTDIISVKVSDNGIGFNEKNRTSFDTIYSPKKKDIGGKGFGRFFYLKHFSSASIESYYFEDQILKKRTFDFGQEYNVVVNENVDDIDHHDTGTVLILKNIRQGKFDRDAELFAHRILERLLSYFVDDKYQCPKIVIHDSELAQPIVLNDLIGDKDDSLIRRIDDGTFDLNGQNFKYKLFKLYKMRTQKSRIVLTARNQSVTDVMLESYVPEFASDFEEEFTDADGKRAARNFIIRFYVQADYLDDNVTTERDNFNFNNKNSQTSIFPVSKEDIERAVANSAKEKFSDEFNLRFAKKKKKYESYAEENIWYKPYVEDLDLENLKAAPTKEELEAIMHKAKYAKDLEIKRSIASLTSGLSTNQDAEAVAGDVIKKAKQASVSDLAQYVAFRKAILDLLENTIKLTIDGVYSSEKEIHNIIFPTNRSTGDTAYEGHNLWVLDERLTFTQHVTSDQNIFSGSNRDRPDIAAFHYLVGYRDINEKHSPVSVFEFKKPGRHDFVNKSSKEDPFDQIKRYVQSIKDGQVKTIDGTQVLIGENTPFYGYIVADSDKQVEQWLQRENFKALPDGQGWYYNHDGLNLYVEYVTWQKLINDAKIRHRKFFELLGAV